MSVNSQTLGTLSAKPAYQSTGYGDLVLQTQISRLIEGSGFSNLAGFLMAIIWVGLLWDALPHLVLGVWLGGMAVLFLYRAVVHYFHLYDTDKVGFSANLLRRWYLLAVLFTGIGWGVTSILMFPYKQIEQIILAFILVGVSASGVTYAQVGWVYFGYVGFVLLPLMLRLFYVGGEVYYAMSAMTGFFLGVMIMAAYRMYKSSTDALELSYKNEELIQNLTLARNDLERLNLDLTEEIDHVKRIESELKLAKDHAEQMSQVKGEFLANMSHEIRTPMNGVMGTLQLLEGTQLTDSQQEYVRTAHKSADALLAILNDILDLSKIEAGKLDIEIIPFDLREVVLDLVALHSLKAEQKGVTLEYDIDEQLPHTVAGDPTRIRQILINLVSNALKFTHDGAVNVRLSVISQDQKRVNIKVEVNDSGIGISEAVQEKLFNAFTQADGSTTRKYGGTGLGLAIVKQLVEMMQGELGVESSDGEGTTFWFKLTLGASKALPEASDTDIEGWDEMLEGRVLLVEDNPINQMVAAKMLEKLGLEPLPVANGKEAVDLLKTERVDLVLMDCQMPVMDGFAATREIREREQRQGQSRLPIVAMTANVMEGDRERCLESGMDEYLGKPVKLDELEKIIRRVLKAVA